MKDMKKIAFLQLPPVIENALSEHLAGFAVARVQNKAALLQEDPDLVVTGEPVHLPACPVLTVPLTQPLRLGDILREIGRMAAQPVLYIDDMSIGDYIFKPQERALTRADAEDIPLTDREVDILAYLIRHRAAPVSREELLKNVWQYQQGVDTHTLETHIYRLRQKMEASVESPQLLLTVEGGYTLNISGGAA